MGSSGVSAVGNTRIVAVESGNSEGKTLLSRKNSTSNVRGNLDTELSTESSDDVESAVKSQNVENTESSVWPSVGIAVFVIAFFSFLGWVCYNKIQGDKKLVDEIFNKTKNHANSGEQEEYKTKINKLIAIDNQVRGGFDIFKLEYFFKNIDSKVAYELITILGDRGCAAERFVNLLAYLTEDSRDALIDLVNKFGNDSKEDSGSCDGNHAKVLSYVLAAICSGQTGVEGLGESFKKKLEDGGRNDFVKDLAKIIDDCAKGERYVSSLGNKKTVNMSAFMNAVKDLINGTNSKVSSSNIVNVSNNNSMLLGSNAPC